MTDDVSQCYLTQAAELLGVRESTLSHFFVRDPFNEPNTLEGHLCRQSDHRYGALVIQQVNLRNLRKPQVVYATPKLRYPFARTDDQDDDCRRYHFPEKVLWVKVYEKLDGTNICAYSYADAEGRRYVTFKTRLTPVIGESRYGNFRGMWRELLESDEDLAKLLGYAQCGACSLSFEMYGYRNPHLVVYDVPLAAKFIFYVDQLHGAVGPPPPSMCPSEELRLLPVATFTDQQDLVAFYNQKREEAEAGNRTFEEDGEERVEGTEGFVFYVLDEDGYKTMWKCKPSSIEAIHWVGDTIPLSIVLPTCWNALESCEGELTVEYVEELLAEEFKPHQVDASRPRVEKAVGIVLERLAWRARVQEEYSSCGATFEKDGKGPVMRALAARFDRGKMRRVFGALRELGIAPARREGR